MDARPSFKMLHSYQKEDADIFFGRDEEIRKLISFTYTTDLILVYGETGTGKTSLVQCGLTKGFNDDDRLEVYIRKGDNINLSMIDKLNHRAYTPISSDDGLNDAVHSLYLDFLKPVYLIFDQFEELFVSGTTKERNEFYRSIQELLASGAPARVILVMREEYLALLNDFEEVVPSLFDYRLRVETIKKHTLFEVIENSLDRFGIKVEDSKNTIEDIIHYNQDHRSEVRLPYLQVYLDRLYREAEKLRTSPVIFTRELVKKIGKINDVLFLFLDEQITKIQLEISSKYPHPGRDLVWRILNEFVSDEGKRKRVSSIQLEHLLSAGNKEKKNELKFTLGRLVESRILNTLGKGDNYEIAHDTLANSIDQKRTTREKLSLAAERLIKEKQNNFAQVKSWLTEEELNIIPYGTREFTDKLQRRLEPKHIDFVRNSLGEVNKKKKQKAYLISIAILIPIILMILWQANTAKRAKNDKGSSLAMQAHSESQEDPTVALGLAEAARKLSEKKLVSGTIHDLYSKHRFYKILVDSKKEVLAFDVSKDGKRFLTGHNDGSAGIWDELGKLVFTLEKQFGRDGHTSSVSAVAFSPDGNTVVTGSYDQTAILWDIRNNEPIPRKVLNIHKGSIECAAFSPDGKFIITGSEDATAILWDMKGKPVQVFKGHTSSISSVSFSPDGKYILTASFDSSARIWDLNGNEIHLLTGHKNAIYAAVFSPGGNAVLTGSADRTARIWLLHKDLIAELEGHGESISSVAFSPDGRRIVTGSMDRTLRIWDWQGNTLQVLKGHNGEILDLHFAPYDVNFLFSGSYDGSIRLWDLHGSPLQIFKGHKQTISSVAFVNEGERVLTGSQDKTARLWNEHGNFFDTFEGDMGEIYAVAASPDNTQILTASHKSVWLWTLSDFSKIELAGHGNWVYAAAFSPKGNLILTGSYDTTARLWERDGTMLREIPAHSKKITSVTFSPNGEHFLTGSQDKTARLWNVRGDLLVNFIGHTETVTSVAYTPGGNAVLTGSQDNTARLWNLMGNVILTLSDHNGPVSCVDVSPSGKYILTGSYDKTVRIWDRQGNLMQVIKGHTGEITSAVFSPDSVRVLSGSMDKTTRLWQIYPMIEFLRNKNFQPLSAAQKKKFGIEN